MALRLIQDEERRRFARHTPAQAGLRSEGLLRPGLLVDLVNFSPRGALVTSAGRMLPGARAELHVWGQTRLTFRGTVVRCRVSAIDPLRYEGAIAFEEAHSDG